MRRIGFGEVARTQTLIDRTLAEVAGTLLTAELALAHGLACNTAGGTHHAFREYGSGAWAARARTGAATPRCRKPPQAAASCRKHTVPHGPSPIAFLVHHIPPPPGFCLINDLAITAELLLRQGRAQRVLILDLDVVRGGSGAAWGSAAQRSLPALRRGAPLPPLGTHTLPTACPCPPLQSGAPCCAAPGRRHGRNLRQSP